MNFITKIKSLGRFKPDEQADKAPEKTNITVFFYDEQRIIKHYIKPLIADYFGDYGYTSDFGSLDSEERFQRFLNSIDVDVDIFFLPTRPEDAWSESQWERRLEELLKNKRIKNVLIFCDEEYINDVYTETIEQKNVFLLLRTVGLEGMDGDIIRPCLDEIKRAIDTN